MGHGMTKKEKVTDRAQDDGTYAEEETSRANPRGVNTKYDEFEVNLWVTNLNSAEIGIYQHSRNRAKSRQFTKDMDIFAEVKVSGERTNLLAYRKSLWGR